MQGGCSAPPALCFWAGLHLAAHTLCTIPATRRTARLQGVSEEAYASVVVAHLQERLAGSAGSGFDELILGPALAYATSVPLQFLELALPPGVSGGRAGGRSRVCCSWAAGSGCREEGPCLASAAVADTMQPAGRSCAVQEAGAAAAREWQARLSYYVYEAVGGLRIADMFDIVVDYPDR